jgi:chitin disaccharide deacetylase
MAPSGIRVITRADDLGSFRSANRAIYDAYKKGVLRNAGVIVPAHEFDHAVDMFRGEKEFCLGLHAAVTCEWNTVRWKPLLAASARSCFVDNQGAMHKSVQEIQDSGKVSFGEILTEVQAQLDKARKAGLDIRYVDAHMAFPWVFEGGDDSKRCADPLARWIEKEGLVNAAWGSTLPLSRFDRPAAPTGDRITDLAAMVRGAKPGTYVVVSHPMYGTDAEVQPATYGKAAPGKIAAERDIERRMFMDPVILDAYKAAGAQPIRYDQI